VEWRAGHLSRDRVSHMQKAVIDFFKREGRHFPWRDTRDPYVVLVSELLLQKTTARQVLEIFDEFFTRFPSICELADADLETLRTMVRRLGLTKRADYLKSIASEIAEVHQGSVPADGSLLRLKGVGTYTANAVLCFAFGKKMPLVDSNVGRILRRYFGIEGQKPAYADKSLWEVARWILPDVSWREFNYGLLDISASFCRTKPICGNCPLREKCYFAKRRRTGTGQD